MGKQSGLLSSDMFEFGLEILKVENSLSEQELWEVNCPTYNLNKV